MNEDIKLLRELKSEGEEIVYSDRKKGMILLSSIWDDSRNSKMEELSLKYGIDSRQKFNEFKEKYNLTDY